MKDFLEKLKENKKLTLVIAFIVLMGAAFIWSSSPPKKKKKKASEEVSLSNPNKNYLSFLTEKEKKKKTGEVEIVEKKTPLELIAGREPESEEVYLKDGKLYKGSKVIATGVKGVDAKGNYILEGGEKVSPEGEKLPLPGVKKLTRADLKKAIEERKKARRKRQKELEEKRKREEVRRVLKNRPVRVKTKRVRVEKPKPKNFREQYALLRNSQALSPAYIQVTPEDIELPEKKEVKEPESPPAPQPEEKPETEVLLPGTQLVAKLLSGAKVSPTHSSFFTAEILFAFGPKYETKHLEGCFLTGEVALDESIRRGIVKTAYLSCPGMVGTVNAVGLDFDLLEGLRGKYKSHFLERVALAAGSRALQEGAQAMQEAQVEETPSSVAVQGSSNQVSSGSKEVARNVKNEKKYALWGAVSGATEEITSEAEKSKSIYLPTLKIKSGKVVVFSLTEPSELKAIYK